MTQQVTVGGETLELLAERAVWWPRRSALLVADIHWAKGGHFRRHGIAMPPGIQAADGQRLADLVREYSAERLIVAGDFFHSRHNAEVDDFTYWRAQHQALQIDFIRGNHDILPPEAYASWNLNVYETGLELFPYYITHDKAFKEGLFTIYGHLHPGLRIGKGRPMPCFCLNENEMILPAFGSFTGCKVVHPSAYESIYVIGEGKVLRVK